MTDLAAPRPRLIPEAEPPDTFAGLARHLPKVREKECDGDMTEKKRYPLSLRTQISLNDPASSDPIMELHGFIAGSDQQGRLNYAGIATLPDGRFVASFRGMVAESLVVIRKIPKPRGRPTNEPARIAKLLNNRMAELMHEARGGTLTQWRAAAYTAMRFGNEDAPRNQAKELYDAAKCAKEIPAVRSAPFVFGWTGDEAGKGRVAALFLAGADVQSETPEVVCVAGRAWLCEWGKREAHRAEIRVSLRAKHPQQLKDQRAFVEEFSGHNT